MKRKSCPAGTVANGIVGVSFSISLLLLYCMALCYLVYAVPCVLVLLILGDLERQDYGFIYSNPILLLSFDKFLSCVILNR